MNRGERSCKVGRDVKIFFDLSERPWAMCEDLRR